MTKKIIIGAILAVVIGITFFFASKQNIPSGYPEDANLLPMYGNIEKPPHIIATDEQFIQSATGNGQITKEEASMYMTYVGGWGYFFTEEYDMSMKRFNQAWLLNPENYHVYWGFGRLLEKQNKNNEAKEMYEKALSYYKQNNQKNLMKYYHDNAVIEVNKNNLNTLQLTYLNFMIDSYELSETMIYCDIAKIIGQDCK